MDIHIYIDNSSYSEMDLRDFKDDVVLDLETWAEGKSKVSLLNSCPEEIEEDWRIGLALQIKSKFKMKDPINFLYELATKYKCEFVVAEFDKQSDQSEAVCYFGFEEGRPDLYEIANYLGL